MAVLWIALPVTLLLATGFVVAFIISARKGQFDDTETPPLRMLLDDEPAPKRPDTQPNASNKATAGGDE